MTTLKSFTYTYSGSAENQSNPAADSDALADAAAVTDDQFYVLLDGGMQRLEMVMASVLLKVYQVSFLLMALIQRKKMDRDE